MSRWKAALIHLGISVLIAAVVAALLTFVWYPPPWLSADGGLRLLSLIVGVDVTLGPLVTLVVFRHGKPGLKFDLAVIGAIQSLALIYGLHTMLASRPVFLVAAVDQFRLVAANQLDPNDIAEAARPEWRHLSWTGPILVGTVLPKTHEQREELLSSALKGKDIEKLPRYYVPYEQAATDLLARAHPLAKLRDMHPTRSTDITQWVMHHQQQEKNIVWLPVVARDADLTMMLDAHNGEPLGAINIDPWQSDPAD